MLLCNKGLSMPANYVDGVMGDINQNQLPGYNLDNKSVDKGRSFLDNTPAPDEDVRTTYFHSTCLDCMPGAPVDAIISTQKKIESTPPKEMEELIEQINNNRQSIVLDKLKACNKTVLDMRKPIKADGVDRQFDMIQGFDKLCIGKGVSNLTLSSCRSNYDSYIDDCLSGVKNVADQRIVNRVGLLVVSKGNFKGMPACTATIISNRYLLTARHCYVGKDGDKEGIGNDYLTFSPNQNIEDLNKNLDGKIIGELTEDGIKDINMLDVQPTISQDVIILVLKDSIQLEKPEIKIKFAQEVKNWQQLTLLGYQEMLTRKDDLYSQGYHLPDGKTVRYFLQNFLMDDSKSCFVGAYKPGGFQHSCQSLYGTSGAPLFIGDLKDSNVASDTVYIAGIQSRGNESTAIDLEKQGAANSASAINATTLTALLKNGVDMR